MSHPTSPRRTFLGSVLSGTAALWVSATGLLSTVLAACEPTTKYGGPPPLPEPKYGGPPPPPMGDDETAPAPVEATGSGGGPDSTASAEPPAVVTKYGGPPGPTMVPKYGGPVPPPTVTAPPVTVKYGGPPVTTKYGGPSTPHGF